MRRLAIVLALLAAPAAMAEGGFEALRGHGGPVHAAALAGEGGVALTASFDNSVGVWSLATGSLTRLEGHGAAVKAVIPTGPGRVASGGDDFDVILWDLGTGAVLHRLEGHAGQVAGLAAAGDLLASAGWDGAIGLWALGTGERRGWIEGHDGPVNAVAFLRDGARLLSASADGTLRIWDTESGAEIRTLARHGFGITSLLVNEAGGWLVYGATDGGTRVLALDGTEIADLTLGRRPVLALAASPSGDRIAVGDGEGYVMVVGTDGWRILHDFRAAARGPVWALAWTGDDRLLMGGIDDTAMLWPVGQTEIGPILATEARSFLADPETLSNGARQFARKCSICHDLTGATSAKAGPTLDGLFGRQAGTVPDYPYSETLDGSGIVWTAETIDALFDEGPDHYIPGSKMPMQRITGAEDRADLIRYLAENT